VTDKAKELIIDNMGEIHTLLKKRGYTKTWYCRLSKKEGEKAMRKIKSLENREEAKDVKS